MIRGKMRKFPLLILATVILLFLTPLAGANDGNDLLTNCNAALTAADHKETSSEDTTILIRGSFCLGLMQGIKHLNRVYELKLKQDALFCLPESDISNEQAARIIVKYLKDHPEKLHLPDSFLAITAFINAYPCK